MVTDYLEASGLQKELDAIGYNLVGYGCTTCIGNSGPLADPIAEAVDKGDERWRKIEVIGGDTYGWPARSWPRGSRVRSRSIRPAIANATTRGGDIR